MINRILLAMAAWLLAISSAGAADATSQSACNRECLRGYITQYLDALAKRDYKSLPVAADVKFTEDGKLLELGEGLWKDASALRPYRMDFIDVRRGVAGTHAVIEAGGGPVLLGLRLKIIARQLTEIETFAVRNEKEGLIFDVDALKVPSNAMTLTPPPPQRESREEIVRISDYYSAGLKAGSFVKVDAPFAPNAYRIENGRLMAGPGCTQRAACENIKTQPSPERPTLTSRLMGVDEELGIGWYRLTWQRPENKSKLVVWEAFKVYGKQMHAVEAFIQLEPIDAPSGWE